MISTSIEMSLEESYLSDAIKAVQTQSFYMKRAMDEPYSSKSVSLIIKHASEICTELRTSLLSPKSYYRLYIIVTEELTSFSSYINTNESKIVIKDLCIQVQSCGNVLPRLYLLITVATTCIRENVESDLVDLAHGIQDPIRGLFLRNYLVSCMKKTGPSLDFLFTNLSETLRLWSRIPNAATRNDVAMFATTSLIAISNLDIVTIESYELEILPKLLEICNMHLLDCIVQVFPDTFHLKTITPLLTAVYKTQDKSNMSEVVMIGLLNRLTAFSADDDDTSNSTTDCNKYDEIQKIILSHQNTDKILISLIKYAIAVTKDNEELLVERISEVVKEAAAPTIGSAESLITLVYTTVGLRGLTNELLVLQERSSEKITTALSFLKYLISKNISIPSEDSLSRVLRFIKTLSSEENISSTTSYSFEECQTTVATLVFLITNPFSDDDFEKFFKMLTIARKSLGSGGVKRIEFTLVPLVYKALEETKHSSETNDNNRRLLQYVHEIITALATSKYQLLALKLFCIAAVRASKVGMTVISSEFFSQACVLYEGDDALKENTSVLTILIGSLLQCNDNEDTKLKVTTYAAKLSKKVDQVLLISQCSYLFRNSPDRLLECLQRSLRIADNLVSSNASSHLGLFIMLLEHYVHFFKAGVPSITKAYVDGLSALIAEHLSDSGGNDTNERQYESIKKII